LSIVWLIEKDCHIDGSVANALIGNFAVRVFGSSSSFLKLRKLSGSSRPCVVVIDIDSLGLSKEQVDLLISERTIDVPKILLSTSVSDAYSLRPGIFVHPRNCDPLELCRFLNGFSSNDKPRSGAVRFKDLLLDPLHAELTIEPDVSKQSLPPKEARILSLLMMAGGKPVARDELITELWDGIKVSSRTLDSHVSRLRRRIEGSEATIENIYGGGYVLR